MPLLEYERDMLLSVLNEDSLSIASKGIGIERLLINIIKAYCDECNLVYIIGSTPEEDDFIIEQLKQENVIKLPTKVTSENVAVNQRNALYLSGGVFLITSRILVVDMLCNRVPFQLISGIIVCKAHRILEDSQQSFIMRLYRTNNKKGFITAISQSPASFIGGFGKLEKIMRQLFVNKLFLWPRFHVSINSSLSERISPEVIEIRLTMTQSMQEIQFSLMDLISMSLKELNGCSSSFLYDSSDFTAENVIAGNFGKVIRVQLDPIWHQLSAKAKRLINDIRLLRTLLFHLISYDSVTFYSEIKSIRQNVVLNSETSDWLFWEPTEKLFVCAKKRLFNEAGGLDFEKHPKWLAFDEIIGEIQKENIDNQDIVDVIVIVENERTMKQLNDLREKGADLILSEMYNQCESLLDSSAKQESSQSTSKKNTSKGKKENVNTLTQLLKKFDQTSETNSIDIKLRIHYHQWRDNKSIFLDELLIKLSPKYIILYEPEMQCIRQIEIHQAMKLSSERIKIYFFMFDKSAEEQRYLKSLHGEKEAFESLITTKSTMIIPAERDSREENHPDLIRGDQSEPSTSSRQAGGRIQNRQVVHQKIIVDMREFRSDLPSLIHKQGIDVEPFTLEIGDYLLTPDTCVERKSVSDLIGSFNSGRLYHQTQIMTRFYRRSILLIEFDDQKSFNFKGRYWGVTSTVSGRQYDVLAKLVVLTTHFPLLRLIWSPSPNFSAQVFEHLKEDKEQPDASQALTLSGKQLPAEFSNERYDFEAKEFLLCLPGITPNNVYSIMNQVDCIADLVDLSVERLTEIMSKSQQAQTLYKSLHTIMSSIDKN